jgi:hypothetical protein
MTINESLLIYISKLIKKLENHCLSILFSYWLEFRNLENLVYFVKSVNQQIRK